MLKIQVEGELDQVRPYLHDLQNNPYVNVVLQELPPQNFATTDVKIQCYIEYSPDRSPDCQTVRLCTMDGQEITIPLFNVVIAEMDNEQVIVAGTHRDLVTPRDPVK